MLNLFEDVVPILLEASHFPEVIAGYGDPNAWMKKEVQRLEMLLTHMGDRDPAIGDIVRGNLTAKVAPLYQASLGTKTNDELAAMLAARVVESDPSMRVWVFSVQAVNASLVKSVSRRDHALFAMPVRPLNSINGLLGNPGAYSLASALLTLQAPNGRLKESRHAARFQR